MSKKLRSKLDLLHKEKIKKQWENLESQQDLSTKEKLEQLVQKNLKRKERKVLKTKDPLPEQRVISTEDIFYHETTPEVQEEDSNGFTVKEFAYPTSQVYGKFPLSEWKTITPIQLALLTADEEFLEVDPQKMLFFDTETTGLAGGTGTIPFMLGFAYFTETHFQTKIYILDDLHREGDMLDAVDAFLAEKGFSATVTYNGKTFDFTLMEARYILQRKRFPLLKLPHLDFLFPARTLWKYTHESRRLGHLGEMLLGLSREDDIDGSEIPRLYFNYLRTKSYNIIRQVVEHNAMDLVGLAGLMLIGAKYLDDITHTVDEGEILGTARIYENYNDLDKAEQLYQLLKNTAQRSEIQETTIKRLSFLKKKKKLYSEAADLWETLSTHTQNAPLALKELSIHLEHREKNYPRAIELTRQALENITLTETQREDFQKRCQRLERKLKKLEENQDA